MTIKYRDKKEYENVHIVFRWYMWHYDFLSEALTFGALSTDHKTADGYNIGLFVSGPYTTQDETVIDRKNIMSGERVVNKTNLKKL